MARNSGHEQSSSSLDVPDGVPWDSRQFGSLYDYDSVEAFIAARRLPEGVHRIGIPGSPALEIYIRGLSGPRGIAHRVLSKLGHSLHHNRGYLPCFFTAATADRAGTKGPYFTGLHVQLSPLAPMVAVADPLLGSDPDVRIGWYTGLPHTNTQTAIARALAHVASLAGRPLLTVGGSAGGYAAMLYASLMCDSSLTGSIIASKSAAFVWNPQVSITDYTFVQPYLDVMFPEHKGIRGAQAAQMLSDSGIIHDLRSIAMPGRFLYVQNLSDDDHVLRHAQPYIEAHGLREVGEGLFEAGDHQMMVIAHYGDGHAPLPRAVMRLLLATLRRGHSAPSDLREFLESAGDAQPVEPSSWDQLARKLLGAWEKWRVARAGKR